MKKFKLLPAVLMLVLCVGVLAVGVFAITPTKNTISGTITVTSSNPEVEIQVVQVTKNTSGQDVETPIGSKYTVRAGVDLDFGNLNFSTATANLVSDVSDIIVRLDVTNKSGEDLGMYFATNSAVNAGTAKTESIDIVENVLEAQFSDYIKLPKDNGTASSAITFHLKNFPSSDINLKLDTLTLFFNIEKFNPALTSVETQMYSFKNGTLMLKEGAGSGEFTDSKLLEINNSLANEGVSITDVKEFNFGTSEFTIINVYSSFRKYDLDSLILSENITSIKKIVVRADKVWVPDNVVNFYCEAFVGCCEEELTYGYDWGSMYDECTDPTPSITLYFEAENDDNINFYLNYGDFFNAFEMNGVTAEELGITIEDNYAKLSNKIQWGDDRGDKVSLMDPEFGRYGTCSCGNADSSFGSDTLIFGNTYEEFLAVK